MEVLREYFFQDSETAVGLARTGRVLKTIPPVGDADEIWCDPGLNRYYFAPKYRGAAEATSARSDISIEGTGVHSVAVNAKNKHIFAPVAGKGILVITVGE